MLGTVGISRATVLDVVGGSRLFQASVQRKLVKETTGHSSDAVDAYQITSDEQRQQISNILSQKPTPRPDAHPTDIVTGNAIQPKVQISNSEIGSQSKQSTVNIDEAKSKCSCASSNVGNMVEKIISDVQSSGKTTIKIQIEIIKE